MKYNQLNEVINQINGIKGKPEEKVIKKLVKFIEKLKLFGYLSNFFYNWWYIIPYNCKVKLSR